MSQQPFDPNDVAIIETAPEEGYKTVEPVAYLMGLVLRDWNRDNCDNKKPLCEFAEKTAGVNFVGNDWMVFYLTSKNTRPGTINYSHVNITYVISIDCYTSGDRIHAQKLYDELQRVLWLNRTDTFGNNSITGRVWMRPMIRTTDFQTTLKNQYRFVVDNEIRWEMRTIQT